MDQGLSLLSKDKLSKGEKKTGKRGANKASQRELRESFQWRDQGELPGGRGMEGWMK